MATWIRQGQRGEKKGKKQHGGLAQTGKGQQRDQTPKLIKKLGVIDMFPTSIWYCFHLQMSGLWIMFTYHPDTPHALWETCVLMGDLINIWFLKSNFMKYENQILIWKITLLSYTLSRPHFLFLDCPFGLHHI